MHHQRNVDRQPLHWLSRRKFGPKPNIGQKGSIWPDIASPPDRPACSWCIGHGQGTRRLTDPVKKIVTTPAAAPAFR
jgi:hypothetical protein